MILKSTVLVNKVNFKVFIWSHFLFHCGIKCLFVSITRVISFFLAAHFVVSSHAIMLSKILWLWLRFLRLWFTKFAGNVYRQRSQTISCVKDTLKKKVHNPLFFLVEFCAAKCFLRFFTSKFVIWEVFFCYNFSVCFRDIKWSHIVFALYHNETNNKTIAYGPI